MAGGDPEYQQVLAAEGEEGSRKEPGRCQEGATKGLLLAGEVQGMRWKDCPVCLCEYEAGDIITWLPGCTHAFHGPCIEAWLGSQTTCPLCRVSVKPELEDLAAEGSPHTMHPLGNLMQYRTYTVRVA